MFGIFANSFLTATRTRAMPRQDGNAALPRLSWTEEDSPFRHYAGRRSARDD